MKSQLIINHHYRLILTIYKFQNQYLCSYGHQSCHSSWCCFSQHIFCPYSRDRLFTYSCICSHHYLCRYLRRSLIILNAELRKMHSRPKTNEYVACRTQKWLTRLLAKVSYWTLRLSEETKFTIKIHITSQLKTYHFSLIYISGLGATELFDLFG